MFEVLSDRFTKIFSKLSKKRNLTESNIAETLEDIKKALLASDVNFEVVQKFIGEIKEECIGQRVFKNVKPGQQVVKIVYDKLREILSNEQSEIDSKRPLRIMMVGLHGAGKTTTSAKLAKWFKKQDEQPALVACDIHRPAAIDQLKTLGEQIEIPVLAYGQIPVEQIASKALEETKQNTVTIFDTAGRLQIDEALIQEAKILKERIQPHEILLVIDSALGQEAVNVTQAFNEALGLTGVILTKLDGDTKGGAALSMKYTTHLPIKFSGIGEKLEDFEKFYPDRMASRILGMGDIISLVEKAQEEIASDTVEAITKRLFDGEFNLEDFLSQVQQMKKLGSHGLGKWLPNLSTFQNMDQQNEEIKQFETLILSMTPQERRQPNLLVSSYRKMRIIKGAGMTIADFNKLIKRFQLMKKMSQKIKKSDPNKLRQMFDRFSNGASFLSDHKFFK